MAQLWDYVYTHYFMKSWHSGNVTPTLAWYIYCHSVVVTLSKI